MSLTKKGRDYVPKFSSLQIKDLSLHVKLGCTAEERENPQEVLFSAEFRFLSPPRGALTDSLNDTLCYAKMSALIRSHCEGPEFNLIERMGTECYALLREFVNSSEIEIYVHIHKVKPPVSNLKNGTHFTCGDFLL